MSKIKISKHAEVLAALELVVEEVGKESQRIREAGSEALKVGKLKPAKEAIAYAEKMDDFVKRIERLGVEWQKLQEKIGAAAPEVKEIVLPTKIGKPHKTGYTRKVGQIAHKTNFTVTFPDGSVIQDKKAKVVFAKTIEKLGAEAVAALNIVQGGEPLLSRDEKAFAKQPTQVHPIADGWYVKTHSSTGAKMKLLQKIGKAQKVKLRIQLCK